MKCLFLIATVQWLQFHAYDVYDAINLYQIESYLICLFCFNLCMDRRSKYVFSVLTIFYWHIAMFDFVAENICFWFVCLEMFFLLIMVDYQLKRNYERHIDKPNRETVCLFVYIPRSLSQYIQTMFFKPYYSCGVIIGDKRYQFIRNKNTIQELDWGSSIIDEYDVYDTHCPVDKVKHLIPELLKQKVRRPRTLWLRYNCIISLYLILNEIGGRWKPFGEVFPFYYFYKR